MSFPDAKQPALSLPSIDHLQGHVAALGSHDLQQTKADDKRGREAPPPAKHLTGLEDVGQPASLKEVALKRLFAVIRAAGLPRAHPDSKAKAESFLDPEVAQTSGDRLVAQFHDAAMAVGGPYMEPADLRAFLGELFQIEDPGSVAKMGAALGAAIGGPDLAPARFAEILDALFDKRLEPQVVDILGGFGLAMGGAAMSPAQQDHWIARVLEIVTPMSHPVWNVRFMNGLTKALGGADMPPALAVRLFDSVLRIPYWGPDEYSRSKVNLLRGICEGLGGNSMPDRHADALLAFLRGMPQPLTVSECGAAIGLMPVSVERKLSALFSATQVLDTRACRDLAAGAWSEVRCDGSADGITEGLVKYGGLCGPERHAALLRGVARDADLDQCERLIRAMASTYGKVPHQQFAGAAAALRAALPKLSEYRFFLLLHRLGKGVLAPAVEGGKSIEDRRLELLGVRQCLGRQWNYHIGLEIQSAHWLPHGHMAQLLSALDSQG